MYAIKPNNMFAWKQQSNTITSLYVSLQAAHPKLLITKELYVHNSAIVSNLSHAHNCNNIKEPVTSSLSSL